MKNFENSIQSQEMRETDVLNNKAASINNDSEKKLSDWERQQIEKQKDVLKDEIKDMKLLESAYRSIKESNLDVDWDDSETFNREDMSKMPWDMVRALWGSIAAAFTFDKSRENTINTTWVNHVEVDVKWSLNDKVLLSEEQLQSLWYHVQSAVYFLNRNEGKLKSFLQNTTKFDEFRESRIKKEKEIAQYQKQLDS